VRDIGDKSEKNGFTLISLLIDEGEGRKLGKLLGLKNVCSSILRKLGTQS